MLEIHFRRPPLPSTLHSPNVRQIHEHSCIKPVKQQESPPAWTQEAYRPLCSKYSLCCPNWVPPPGGGYPVRYTPPGGSGYPPWGGYWVPPPGPGTPPGGYPGGVPDRVPPLGGRGGTWTPVRYPSRGGPGTPPGGGTRSGTPPGGGYPDPPPPPLWTDKHLWKQYLPVVLRTRAVNIHLDDYRWSSFFTFVWIQNIDASKCSTFLDFWNVSWLPPTWTCRQIFWFKQDNRLTKLSEKILSQVNCTKRGTQQHTLSECSVSSSVRIPSQPMTNAPSSTTTSYPVFMKYIKSKIIHRQRIRLIYR